MYVRLMRFFLFVFLAPLLLSALEYTRLQTAVHVLEVDPSKYAIRPVKALDNGIGRESVLSLYTRHGAVASINGGFFTIGGTFDGKVCGALKIDDWIAFPTKPRGCIGWSRVDPNPILDRLSVSATAQCNALEIPLDGLNRPRKEGEILLFTPSFHRTTLTNPDGEEVVVVDGVIRNVVKGGSTKIPENGFVLSIQEKHPFFDSFAIGMPLTITTRMDPWITSPNQWDVDYIVGGTPLLLYQHIRISDYTAEQTIPTFLSNRHARTAVGILPNGNWIFVIVDKTGFLDGMTIYELTDLMEELGCVHALNLCGGGCSTLVHEGIVKNTPYGNEDEGANTVRRVSDAIIILPK